MIAQLFQSFLTQKMSNICWFQLLKCDDLPFFLSFLTVNEECLGFARHFELWEIVMNIFSQLFDILQTKQLVVK